MDKTANGCVSASKRYETIDIAKGFAIVLVVIGHFVSDYMPRGYHIVRDVIYMFHMPLFVFASGFLYQATRRKVGYLSFIKGKFKRLIVPYFTVSVLVTGIKLATSGILPLENPVTVYSFVEILWYPSAGFFLWFLWALWWMMVIIPWFNTPKLRLLLLSVSLILHFVAPQFPAIFCLDKFAEMLVFFSLGTVVSDYMNKRNVSVAPMWSQIVSVIVFALFAWGMEIEFIAVTGLSGAINLLVVNIMGIAMSLSLSYWWRISASKRVLIVTYSLAGSSYVIYMWHTTLEGFAKGVLYKVGWFEHTPLLLTAWTGALIVVAAGVLIPWWLARCVFNRWRVTSLLFGVNRVSDKK